MTCKINTVRQSIDIRHIHIWNNSYFKVSSADRRRKITIRCFYDYEVNYEVKFVLDDFISSSGKGGISNDSMNYALLLYQ